MADTDEVSPTNLLDQLASLAPQERREVATIVRDLSETLAEVPDGKTASHTLGVLGYLLEAGQYHNTSQASTCTRRSRRLMDRQNPASAECKI
jgi:hypothetical protein